MASATTKTIALRVSLDDAAWIEAETERRGMKNVTEFLRFIITKAREGQAMPPKKAPGSVAAKASPAGHNVLPVTGQGKTFKGSIPKKGK